MTDKPKALVLAERLLDARTISTNTEEQAAAELRRLHEVNQVLVDALEEIESAHVRFDNMSAFGDRYEQESSNYQLTNARKKVQAALVKANKSTASKNILELKK